MPPKNTHPLSAKSPWVKRPGGGCAEPAAMQDGGSAGREMQKAGRKRRLAVPSAARRAEKKKEKP